MGKEAQVSSVERWAHPPEQLAAGGGQGFRQRKGRREFTQRRRSCFVPPRTAGQQRGREWGGRGGLPVD